jgi:hypothetical protein
VSRVPADDEAQRELERRALGNVARLAAKLGYHDVLERRSEKTIAIVLGLLVMALVASLAFSAWRSAGREQQALERQRCEVATFVEIFPGWQQRIRERTPDVSRQRQDELARMYATDDAKYACSQAKPDR